MLVEEKKKQLNPLPSETHHSAVKSWISGRTAYTYVVFQGAHSLFRHYIWLAVVWHGDTGSFQTGEPRPLWKEQDIGGSFMAWAEAQVMGKICFITIRVVWGAQNLDKTYGSFIKKNFEFCAGAYAL